MRSVVWLAKMLYEFALVGKINHKLIIDTLTYNTKNDNFKHPLIRVGNDSYPRLIEEIRDMED